MHGELHFIPPDEFNPTYTTQYFDEKNLVVEKKSRFFFYKFMLVLAYEKKELKFFACAFLVF